MEEGRVRSQEDKRIQLMPFSFCFLLKSDANVWPICCEAENILSETVRDFWHVRGINSPSTERLRPEKLFQLFLDSWCDRGGHSQNRPARLTTHREEIMTCHSLCWETFPQWVNDAVKETDIQDDNIRSVRWKDRYVKQLLYQSPFKVV